MLSSSCSEEDPEVQRGELTRLIQPICCRLTSNPTVCLGSQGLLGSAAPGHSCVWPQGLGQMLPTRVVWSVTSPMRLLEMQIPGPHPRGPGVTAALTEIWYALGG